MMTPCEEGVLNSSGQNLTYNQTFNITSSSLFSPCIFSITVTCHILEPSKPDLAVGSQYHNGPFHLQNKMAILNTP